MTGSELKSTGLLWAFAFVRGRARLLAPGESPLAPPGEAEWLWMHGALSDHRARLFIERYEAIPEDARALILAVEQRVQLRISGEYVFGVLPDIEKEFDGRSGEPGRLLFAMSPRWFISARRHALLVVDDVRRAIEKGEETPTPADLFEALIEHYIDVAQARLQEIAHELDKVEDRVLIARAAPEQSGLGPIRRELSRHHREFVALRSALQRASATRGGLARCGLETMLPTLVQHIEDFDRDGAGLMDRARLLHEEVEAQLANTANKSLRALTILTALMMPATLVVGAFGMNLQGIPFAQDARGFWAIVALCAVVIYGCSIALRRIMR